MVHDLNVFPYPFESSMFDETYIDNTLEHVEYFISFLWQRRPALFLGYSFPFEGV